MRVCPRPVSPLGRVPCPAPSSALASDARELPVPIPVLRWRRLTSASPDPGQALSRPPPADPLRAFTHPVPSSGPICGPSCLHPALPLRLSSQATEIFHFKNDQMRSFS